MTARWSVGGALGEALAVVAGFIALTIVMTYPLAREMQRALPNDLGDPLLVTWLLGWDADRLQQGFQGLWNAPNFYPYPRTLTYSENVLGMAVFSAPVQWLTGNPVFAYNVAFLSSYVLAGSGMYWLTATVTGSRLAAVVSGLAFAFVPYRVSAVPHLHVLSSGWMPVGLCALHRYVGSGSRRALLGFAGAFLLQALSNLYFMYFFTLPAAVVVVSALVRRERPVGRMVAELAAAGSLILLVLAPVAFTYRQTHAEMGFARDRSATVLYSADVSSYAHASPRLVAWGDVLERGRPEGQLFPGVLLLGLASVGLAVGLAPRRRLPETPPAQRRAACLYGLIGGLAFVLSLGPEPAAFGRVLTSSGPFDWLRAVVPGLDGIRVPARLAVVVYLSLSVLAGIALATRLSRVSRGRGILMCGLLSAVVLGEGYGGRMPMVPFEPRQDVDRDAAYQWLATSVPGAVLELPLGADPGQTIYLNVRYQFATLQHGHPLVNGYSGYSTPLFDYLHGARSPLHDLSHYDALLRGLRTLGVRYLVVHRELYGNRSDARLVVEAVRRARGHLVGEFTFGDTTVFWLAGGDEPEQAPDGVLRELEVASALVTASHERDRVPLMLDQDPGTRWLTGRPQRGREWIEIRLERPADVRLLRLGMQARSLGDYPRELVVESIDVHGAARQLYRGGVLGQLLRGLVRDSRWIRVDIPLPPNRTQALRLRQASQTRTWYWSIHELSLFEASVERSDERAAPGNGVAPFTRVHPGAG